VKLSQSHFIDFFCIAIITTMVFSPYALTLSMIGLAAVGVFVLPGRLRLGINWKALSALLRPWRYPAYFIITLFFWITFIGAWEIHDPWYFKARLRIKLPYVLLPLLFIVLPDFSPRKRNTYLLFLIVLLSLTSIGILVNYLLYTEEINMLIKRGKPMPTPRNHIRYSMLVVLGIIAGGYLASIKFIWRFSFEKYLIPALTGFLFIFLHILSVKTGLVVLYASLIFIIFRYFLFSRYYVIALVCLAGLILLPFVAYHTIPSFKSKINYTQYDYQMYAQGQGEVYGDAGRIISLRVGWDIFRSKPILGTGAGNLRKEVEKKFQSEEVEYWETLMPHNQFIFVLAATGIVGLAIFLYAFFFPLIYQKRYKSFLVSTFCFILFVLFMVDHPCETALGVAYHSFFLLLFLSAVNYEANEKAG
jgi:O-antigen ligase